MTDNTTYEQKIANRNNWLKIFVVVVITILLTIKLWQADFTKVIQGFNFSDLLALFLAIFSIALAVLFYLKATDTSNVFYDNTYRFTKDMSEILGRIEAGFGERLKHLDEGYSGLKNAVERIPFDKEKAEEEIKEEEEQLEKVLKERDDIINDLANKAKLEEEEKEKYFISFKMKDKELEDVKSELNRLRKKIKEVDKLGNIGIEIGSKSHHILYEIMWRELGSNFCSLPLHVLSSKFYQIINILPPHIFDELREDKIIDNDSELTLKGFLVIKELCKNINNI